MAHWLVKSEPSVYSFDRLLKDGNTRWDGVRNYAARNHLRAMKLDDEVLFYHSNEGTCVVGIARVSKEAYTDPTGEGDTWSCVDLAPVRKLAQPVELSAMKKVAALKNIGLIRIPRLSVMPLSEKEFDHIVKMGS